MYGKFNSKETKLKMSQIRKGKLQSKETKLKISLTNSKKVFLYINDSALNKKILFKSFSVVNTGFPTGISCNIAYGYCEFIS